MTISPEEIGEIRMMLERVSIAHHIPGRIRLKLKGRPPAWLLEGPGAVKKRLLALPGITEAKLNVLAGSATLHYDKNQLDPAWFDEIESGSVDQLLSYFTEKG